MEGNNEYFFDPFLNNQDSKKPFPNNLEFLCAYSIWACIDSLYLATYILRMDSFIEMWEIISYNEKTIITIINEGITLSQVNIKDIYGKGCVCRIENSRNNPSSNIELLDQLFRSRLCGGSPDQFLIAGSINEFEYNCIVDGINSDFKKTKEYAEQTRTEIITIAESLALYPIPSGQHSNLWYANCPGTNHQLLLNSHLSAFHCGYCKRSGDEKELQIFVKERTSTIGNKSYIEK